MPDIVLILSGDIFTIMSLEDGLAAEGIKSFGTTNLEDAREILIDQRPSIICIVCDIDFAFLKERALFPDVAIVMLTSGNEQPIDNRALMMRKPVSPPDIVTKVKYALSGMEAKSIRDEGKKSCAAG